MFLHFHYNPSATTFASKSHQKIASFLDQKSTKMAFKIDHQTIIDFIIHFIPILPPFWDQFWDHFGDFGFQKGATELKFSKFGMMYVQFLVPRRLGDPTRSHFGTILASFWDHFRSKNVTGTCPSCFAWRCFASLVWLALLYFV